MVLVRAVPILTVDDLDAAYASALERGLEIVHPLPEITTTPSDSS